MEAYKRSNQRSYNLKLVQFIIPGLVFLFFVQKTFLFFVQLEVELRHQELDADLNLSVSVCVPWEVEHRFHSCPLCSQASTKVMLLLKGLNQPECKVPSLQTDLMLKWLPKCSTLRNMQGSVSMKSDVDLQLLDLLDQYGQKSNHIHADVSPSEWYLSKASLLSTKTIVIHFSIFDF